MRIIGGLRVRGWLIVAMASLSQFTTIGSNPLTYAIDSNDAALFEEILQVSPESARDHRRNCNPLAAALRGRSLEFVQSLLSAGANPNEWDDDGNALIELATPEIAEALRKAGARQPTVPRKTPATKVSPNRYPEYSLRSLDPLSRASARGDLETVQKLLKEGASVKPGPAGSALHYAANPFDFELAHKRVQLLSSKFLVAISKAVARAPVPDERLKAKAAIIEELLANNADINSVLLGNTPLHLAAMDPKGILAKPLLARRPALDAQDSSGRTPLHYAAAKGAADLCAALINAGAKLDVKDEVGTPLILALTMTNLPAAKVLLKAGARADVLPTKGPTALNLAAARSAELLQLIFDQQKDIAVNLQDTYGRTPLNYAASEGAVESVRLLLKRGANPDLPDHSGFTPFQSAVEKGHLKVIEELIDRADISRATKDGRTALSLSVPYPEILRLLLKRGADPLGREKNGATSLHHAAIWPCVESCRALLKAGADPILQSAYGSPLDAAFLALLNNNDEYHKAQAGKAASEGFSYIQKTVDPTLFYQIFDLLIENADVQRIGRDRETVLHLAAKRAPARIVKKLIEKGANVSARNRFGNTPLHLAALNNFDPGVVPLLTAHNPPLNAPNLEGTPPICMAASTNNVAAIKALIEAGANINAVDQYLATALHWTAISGEKETAEFLLKHGSNPTARDLAGGHPLHQAIKSKNKTVVELLLPLADLHATMINGMTPLEIAVDVDDPEIFELLLSAGARIDKAERDGMPLTHLARSRYIARRLVELGNDPFRINRNGFNAFQSAVDHGALGPAEYFLSLATNKFAFATEPNRDGTPPLFLAALSYLSKKPEETLADYEAVIEFLLGYGVNPDVKVRGKTALHIAAQAGNIPAITALLRSNAQVNPPDDDGRTPLLIAIREKQQEAAIALITFGSDASFRDNTGVTPADLALRNNETNILRAIDLAKKGGLLHALLQGRNQ